MQLDCPLCCGEKFSSQETLRYHLLSMTVNLYCPACSQLCDGIVQLTEHLENQCKKDDDTTDTTSKTEKHYELITVKQETFNTEISSKDDDIVEESVENTEKEPSEAEGKNDLELEETSEMNSALNSDTVVLEDANSMMIDQNDEQGCSEEIYSCSSCGVNFTSIMQHIEQYHDGQEVVVEMPEGATNLEENELNTETLEGSTEMKKQEHIIPGEYFEDEIDEITDDSEDTDVKYPQILNTLKQEECVDKAGRAYTRKVVQIEKFWDDSIVQSLTTTNKTASNRRQPICETYVLNDDGITLSLEKNDLSNAANETTTDQTNKTVVKWYNCSRCKMQFSKISQFNKHTCDPALASDYKCSQCEVSFNNSKSLCAHMKAHKVNKLDTTGTSVTAPPAVAPFLCIKCDTVFPTNKSLRLHQRMHEPIKAKEIEAPVEYGITGPLVFDPNKPREMFLCPVCNKTYDKGYQLIHMATHSGTDDFHCDICNRKFFTPENLEMHMRVHNDTKPFSCSYCKNSYDTSEALTEHMEVHTKDRPYSCGYCGRKFARPHEKVKHERIHTGEKPHECEICGKTFRVSYCLTLHMRTHTGARPYVCKHCGKRFKAHSVYNHHLLTHSDQRNYKCPYCPKAFKTGVQLAGHKNSHTKPFSCTECNRPFASLYAVRSHMESHKRENNLKFSCYCCGASYARNFALRDHIKEVHQNNMTTSVVLTDDQSQLIMDTDNVKIEEIENFKASNSILPTEDDETEIALNQLREETDEDL